MIMTAITLKTKRATYLSDKEIKMCIVDNDIIDTSRGHMTGHMDTIMLG